MPNASAKATTKIMLVWILEAASGFLAIPFMAFEPIAPMAMAGPTTPKAIVMAMASKFIVCASMFFELFIINLLKRPFYVY
jgi:hypothetical protein